MKTKALIILLKELPPKELLALPGLREELEWHYSSRLAEILKDNKEDENRICRAVLK